MLLLKILKYELTFFKYFLLFLCVEIFSIFIVYFLSLSQILNYFANKIYKQQNLRIETFLYCHDRFIENCFKSI